ncbi:hypothetical protein Y032_0178g694 [Ancylostoma ceylanicum]|uniref:Uncharacterized protein n=1 Tax=Ancylostoma ceylanicum TaxID=53326 RepID=A0A016SU29_9BILA|nr:hypothetical protein Y032_0178g694 [Ancylostoma ceylanicum]
MRIEPLMNPLSSPNSCGAYGRSHGRGQVARTRYFWEHILRSLILFVEVPSSTTLQDGRYLSYVLREIQCVYFGVACERTACHDAWRTGGSAPADNRLNIDRQLAPWQWCACTPARNIHTIHGTETLHFTLTPPICSLKFEARKRISLQFYPYHCQQELLEIFPLGKNPETGPRMGHLTRDMMYMSFGFENGAVRKV